jgi:hypothetical protein
MILLNSTLFINPNSEPQVTEGPDTPKPVSGHCLVQINETTILMTGGGGSNETYFFNVNTSNWTQGPNMIENRTFHSCGIFYLNKQLTVLVAGNSLIFTNTTELLNVYYGTEWIPGK